MLSLAFSSVASISSAVNFFSVLDGEENPRRDSELVALLFSLFGRRRVVVVLPLQRERRRGAILRRLIVIGVRE